MKTTAQLFKALSDETRLRILSLLMNGEVCVCDIMAALDLPQSTVSRHLSYLRNSGWVDDRRCGVWMYYSLANHEDPLRSGILDSLRMTLPCMEMAVSDRLRLDARGRNQNCG
jgi:ArsR family transcriptional regulator